MHAPPPSLPPSLPTFPLALELVQAKPKGGADAAACLDGPPLQAEEEGLAVV